MRRDLRRFRAAILLILAFTLGLGAQLLQAQVTTLPRGSTFSVLRFVSGGVINWNASDLTLTHTANTLTLAGGVWVIPLGGTASPSLTFAGMTTSGLFAATATGVSVTVESAEVALFSRDDFDYSIRLGSTYPLTWSSATTPRSAVADLILLREGAAILQQGVDAASPVAQTFKGADARAGTDSNTAGANVTFAPGRGTGNAASGKLIFAFSNPGASGTQGNPLMNIASFSASGGHFLLPELAVDPSSSNMTSISEIAMYNKSDKFVIAVNRSGIMTFLTIPLDGTTTTWSWSTTAP